MKYNKYKSVILCILLVSVILACKSSKITTTDNISFNLTTKQLIKENSKKHPNFKTLTSRVKIDVVNGDKEQSYTVNLRMEKDKQILLMSTPISVVKALITPERVSFYNKLDNTYFDGDYHYLSDLLGTELDFNKVQNLLLGEALYNLKEGAYSISNDEKSYILQPKEVNELFEVFFLVNPSNYKIDSQQFSQIKELRFLQIDYLKYQVVTKQTLPEQIKIIALEGTDEMNIDLEYKSVTLNEDLRFPFKIPSGYKEIELK